jgi:glycerate kinase
MRILVAPDKFKGTLSARAAADPIASGVAQTSPEVEVECVPLADGGEGTAEVLAPLPEGTVCIEVASTSGSTTQPDALRASSRATGDAMVEAFARPPQRLLVAVGGSSSTDGGVGIAAALGWRFLDARGVDLEPGGAALRALDRIDASGAVRVPCPVIALCDVANPLLGPQGAARTFAPQKGASPEEVEVLEEGLRRLAEVIRVQLGRDVTDLRGAGAGGGIGAGLAAFLDAEPTDGLGYVARAVGLDDAIARSDFVITGEGRFDEGNRSGKVTTGVADIARRFGKPVLLVCGEIAVGEEELEQLGFAAHCDVLSVVGRTSAMAAPAEGLSAAARELAQKWLG